MPAPSSAQARDNGKPDATHDDGISAMAWLREMREMRQEQQKERREQTDAFVDALDKLGGKMETSIEALRGDLRRHLSGLILTFCLSLAVLGALAGVGVWLKFGNTTISTAPGASAAPITTDGADHSADAPETKP